MKLSILPKSITDTEVVDVTSLSQLGDIVTNGRYSQSVFRNSYRKNENFLETSLIVLDYDNAPGSPQLSLEEAKAKFSNHKCLIATTRNHRKEKNGLPAVDRFRVILFLSRTITDAAEFTATWFTVSEQFPGADPACKDVARFFYPSTEVRFANETGLLVEPAKPKEKTVTKLRTLPLGEYGELAQKTIDFMKNGAPEGSWNPRLYSAARDYQEQLYGKDDFIQYATRITGHLDDKDMSTIESAFSKPPKYPPRIRPANMPASERWVREWLSENSVDLSYKTNEITFKGEAKPGDWLVSRMILDAKHWAENNPIVGEDGKEKPRQAYSEALLEHAFSIWISEQRDETINEHRALVEYRAESPGTQILSEWLQIVTGKADPLDLAVMQHFIWQVKRKLNNLPVDWHIMPVLIGKTGSGKTRNLSALLSPIDELLIAPQSLSVLDDTREAFIFGKYLVVFFDEMSRAERVNVEALKNKITSTHVSYRKLGTNLLVTDRNLSTFIGASNKEVQDLIFDPTSARRFWQIRTVDRIEYSKLNQLSHLDVWTSVDESAPSPILNFLENILVIQDKTLRAKLHIENWIEEKMARTTEPTQPISAAFLYELFVQWCEEQHINHIPTRDKFGRELVGLGVVKLRKKQGTFYYLDSDKQQGTNLKIV